MNSSDLGRDVFVGCAAAAMLAGCGGAQPLIGAPGAVPQGRAITAYGERSVSGELLYATQQLSSDFPQVFVFSYPQGKLVQTLTGFVGGPYFICSDRSGDVFIPSTDFSSPGYIYEFAHGGTQPIETLTDPGPGYAQACSVDPKTGNLAVANEQNVAIYPQAQGTPTIYNASDVGARDCAYDDSGNLFVDGTYYQDKIAELPARGAKFSDVTLSESMLTGHLQWRNKYLLIEEPSITVKGPYQIFQVRISGGDGIVSGPVLLKGANKHRGHQVMEFALSGKTLIMPDGPGYSLLNFWSYPKGWQALQGHRPAAS